MPTKKQPDWENSSMRTGSKLALGAIAAAGTMWGARAWLRSRRWIELRERVVVITGSDSGFGLVQARQVAAQGAIVVLAARDPGKLEQAAEAVSRDGAHDVLAIPTDVAEPEQAERLIAQTMERFGRIDVLINTAGLMIVGAEPTLSLEDIHWMMNVNFWGAVHTTRAALPYMRRARFGRIANVSSIGGRFAAPHMLPYTVSKFALTGYTKSLRPEALRDNIYVTGIYPSVIRSGGHRHAWIKGNQEAEYSWFSLGDVIPGVATSVETAAQMAIRAIQCGDPEAIIGLGARLKLAIDGIMPNWSAELMDLMENFFPAPVNLDSPAVQGRDIHGRIPDFTNRQVPDRTRA
jgi:NAD(P)-dependent dehydrogenase (short-subunit alcohol dehydrogenase family)